jgi:xylulokinase
MDHSIATRTLAFDIHRLRWSEHILEVAEIEASKLPETAPSGTIVGEISQKISKHLNLPVEPLLILGGLDQACAAFGAGVIHSGDTLLSLGTVAAIGPVFSSPTLQMREDKILSMPHVVPNKKITFGANIGGGSVLRWYRDQFGYEEREEAQRSNRNVYEVIIDQIPDTPINLLVLPHFSGSRFAFNDPHSEAVISGLTFNSTRHELIQALLEGIAYELVIIRDRFINAGLPISSLNAVGGGSQSDKWLQIIADSMQTPIKAMKISEAGTLGAALLSASALLESQSLIEKVREIVKVRRILEPRTKWAPYHIERVAEYKELYQRMKGLGGNAPSTSDPLE